MADGPQPILQSAPERGVEWTAQDKEKYEAKRQQVIAFYRKVGFRRLGTTQFFMMAKNPSHPSRLVRPEDELPFEDDEPPRAKPELIW